MSVMLGKVSKVRHAVAIASIAGTTALTGTGVIGAGNHAERYDSFQVLIEPAGPDALRITETIDQDFGSNDRHGTERNIPNDYGAPTDVTASSPDAPDDLSAVDFGDYTQIRIGDPNVTVSGQHRYVLSYSLPAADLSDGRFAIDAVGTYFELGFLHAEVVVSGIELSQPNCFVGAFAGIDRCTLEQQAGVYRARVDDLAPGMGVTIDGNITAITTPVAVDPPPLPDRRTDDRLPLTLGVAAAGALGVWPVNRWARRRGSNEVFAGGAADAAHGRMPPPTTDGSMPTPPATTLVPDDELGELATIEFVPPKGIEPWQASVLLTERFHDDTVESWLSGLAGREAIELSEQGAHLTISRGPKFGELGADQSAIIDEMLGGQESYTTGTYNSRFAGAWSRAAAMQRQQIAASGWWKRMPPGSSMSTTSNAGSSIAPLVLFGVFGLLWLGPAVAALLGVFKGWLLALALGLAFPAIVAFFVYRVLLPARSAQGSALALQAESFRRFLHASEAQHVEWAWSQGLLREYSGWAVALGEADAWSRALARANVPEPARVSAGPIIVMGHNASIRSSRTAPTPAGGTGAGRSSSGRFGGGGFSGGSVGGGGGGGGGGSW
jgi:uncharacterized membrane protein YgcG